MSVTWFNVTESFPDLQSPRAGKAQADEGSIWLHIFTLDLGFCFILNNYTMWRREPEKNTSGFGVVRQRKEPEQGASFHLQNKFTAPVPPSQVTSVEHLPKVKGKAGA